MERAQIKTQMRLSRVFKEIEGLMTARCQTHRRVTGLI